MSLLEATNLSVEYSTEDGQLGAVDGVNFALEEGETLGLVGESGSGKSTLAKTILRLLDTNGEITSGEIRLRDHVISEYSKRQLKQDIRWKEISYIPQNAMNALDPVYNVGTQLMEAIHRHTDVSKTQARKRAEERLEDVGLEAARMRDYPHELSGGQQQRVVIALALLLDPSLIIADEITTGLDVIVQDEILELISDIQESSDNSMIFITHDISAVSEVADRVAVMYAGEIIEIGSSHEIFKQSTHPYTIGLRNSFPSLEMLSEGAELVSIPGAPPNLIDPPSGCRFASRCPFATTECEREPDLAHVGNGHQSKCHYNDRSQQFRDKGMQVETWRSNS